METCLLEYDDEADIVIREILLAIISQTYHLPF